MKRCHICIYLCMPYIEFISQSLPDGNKLKCDMYVWCGGGHAYMHGWMYGWVDAWMHACLNSLSSSYFVKPSSYTNLFKNLGIYVLQCMKTCTLWMNSEWRQWQTSVTIKNDHSRKNAVCNIYINKYANTSVTDCDNPITLLSRAFHEKPTNNSWSRSSLPLTKPSGLELYSQEPSAGSNLVGVGVAYEKHT
jgi:hypothetical protein